MYTSLKYDRHNADDVSVDDAVFRQLEDFVSVFLGGENGVEVIGAKPLSIALDKASKGDATYTDDLAQVTDSAMEKLRRTLRDKYIDAMRDRMGGD